MIWYHFEQLCFKKADSGRELALNVHFLLCGWPHGSKMIPLFLEVRITEPQESPSGGTN